jgi:hypothetical protein
MVWDDLSRKGSKSFPAPAEWLAWRRHNTVFADIALTQPAAATLSGDAEPEQVPARKTSANLWGVLGVQPLIGRVFTEEEDETGVRVVVISHGLWQRRYGGSPDVLGRKISVNDNPYEVIGVMPLEFYFMPARDIAIWMPASFPAWMRKNFSWHDAEVVARLKPGVTLTHAKESMAALSLQLTAKDFRGPHATIVTPLRGELAGKTQTALVLLLCAAGRWPGARRAGPDADDSSRNSSPKTLCSPDSAPPRASRSPCRRCDSSKRSYRTPWPRCG